MEERRKRGKIKRRRRWSEGRREGELVGGGGMWEERERVQKKERGEEGVCIWH